MEAYNPDTLPAYIHRKRRRSPSMTRRFRNSCALEPSGGIKGGNCGLPKGISKVAPLRNLKGMGQPVGMILAGGGEFSGSAEVIGSSAPLGRVRLAQQGQRPDGLQDVVFETVVRGAVMNGGTGHNRMGGGERIPSGRVHRSDWGRYPRA